MNFEFNPTSIAIVGASSDSEQISGLPLKYLDKHRYQGTVYPVNPNHDQIRGRPCYSNVSELPKLPELAMVMLPASLVTSITEECLEAGIQNIVIVSSGFSETGTKQGTEWEVELQQLSKKYSANIVGPNSQGIINFPERVTACFTPALERDQLTSGSVSFVTQSGAFGGALTTLFQEEEIGLNKWVATGNEASTGTLEFIEQFAHDNDTEIVVGYIEGFKDARRLVDIKRTDDGIDLPIVVLKVGSSERGQSAASSHTGKIAGKAAVYESILREHGVIAVDDIDLLTAVSRTLVEASSLPGTNLGVISTSGGAGVYLADLASDLGLRLSDLEEATTNEIEQHLPEYGSSMNPVDITAAVLNSTKSFKKCLIALFEDKHIDTLLFQITNLSGDRALDLAETLCQVKSAYDKPALVCWTGGLEKDDALERYAEAGIPVFENPAICMKTIAAIDIFSGSRKPLRAAQELPSRIPTIESEDTIPKKLTEVEAKRLLTEYGIDTPAEHLVTDTETAVDAANELGYPVVMKVVSTKVDHKNRIGGVRLGIETEKDAVRAANELFELAKEVDDPKFGITVQNQIEFNTELSLGIIDDADFGPVLMLGRGGVDIEEVDDATFRTIPTVKDQAESMIHELDTVSSSSFSESQLEAITTAIIGLSALYLDNPWIDEADVNPLVITNKGAVAVDALFSGMESRE